MTADRSPATAANEWRASWMLIAAAMAGYSLSSLPAGSTGVMMAPIEQEFGWSRTEIYSGTALISFVAVGLATFMGAAIDRFGPRRIAIAAALVMCGGMAMLSTVTDSMWHWWASWAVIGVAVSCMPTVWLAPVPGRFTISRGLAVSIVLSGSGIATFLVPIVANALVESHGWRSAYVGLGAIWAVVTLPLILLFFKGSGNARGTPPAVEERGALPGFTVREGLRSANYYKLLIASFCAHFGGVAIVLNLVPVLISEGISRSAAAAAAGLIGIATITGRVFGGWLMDRISAKAIASVSTLLACVLPVGLLLFPGSVEAATAAIVLYGLVGGAKVGAIAYLASRHLGQRAFGTLYGLITAIVALSVGSAPLAANFVYDLTKSYEIVIWTAIPVLLVGSVFYALLGRYPEFDTGPVAALSKTGEPDAVPSRT
ncbi:MAG: MFS transporter [Novosphingobium sp.]|nr:MFS transporter [Novosphingobium sp.]